jgi:hypothetical protein
VVALAAGGVMPGVRRAVAGHVDYLVGIGALPGCVRVPSFGPAVTTRDLASTAPRSVSDFALSLGDVELF